MLLGAETGAVGVLHTWSSTLVYHPHIHFLVPAGGIDEDHQQWIKTKRDYLLPVKTISKVFRARFISSMKKLIDASVINLPDGHCSNILSEQLYKKQWVVYSKKAGKSVNTVVDYLARYTNRVAISNSRIINLENGKVTFRYKDPATGKYTREMSIDHQEFIRRFMQHILPAGFYKIRYFGLYAACNKSVWEQCFALIGKDQFLPQMDGLNSYEVVNMFSDYDFSVCKKCKKGRMVLALPGTKS
jgi:hypothetical protein